VNGVQLQSSISRLSEISYVHQEIPVASICGKEVSGLFNGFSGGFSATHQRRSIYGHSQNSLRSIVYCTNNQIDLWCHVEVLN